MCDQCDPATPKRLSRRSMLIMGAGTLGGTLIGLWNCQPQPQPSSTPSLGGTAPRYETATSSAAPSSAAATTSASPPEAALTPAPDLGAALFPDSTGKPIAQASDAPVILLPRTDWTTTHPNFAQIQLMNGIQRLTVHHTAWSLQTDAWNPTAGELENIREFHAGTRPTDRQWADIAYHFVVDRAGRVWQARPLAYQGAHVKSHNEHNLGIVLLGNFETQSPSAAQLTSLAAFIGFVRSLYHIPLEQVFTHGELGQTSCPGKSLQAYMNRARRSWAAQEHTLWSPPPPPPPPPIPATATAPTMPATLPARTRSASR